MKICLCLHNHQPVGNFEHVMESAYTDCYLPMLEVLQAHEGISAGLHISGTLLEWLQRSHEDYLEICAGLCASGRMEFLTGGRYEPILPVFRRADIAEQIRDFSSRLESLTGSRPRGLWLTERVWEPGLPSVLSGAGVSWAVVDDTHLMRAGAFGADLFRPCVTEDSGRTVRLLPGNMKLRYMIPFSPVEEVMMQLERFSDEGAAVVFYADDGEKFGVWPGTSELCYGRGWLHRFFEAVERSEWLETALPSEGSETAPAGPFYVPATSYSEMGEWNVPLELKSDFEKAMELLREGGSEGSAEIFLAGGFWRNFLSTYPESKELHGRILDSERTVRRSGDTSALHHFWRSQCNCAFWHGVFGGIYLPHLREAVWKELHRADRIALAKLRGHPLVRTSDVNADGMDETLVTARTHSVLVHPHRGCAVSELSIIKGDGEPVPLGHVLSRRREPYHDSIPEDRVTVSKGTIHGEMGSKETGLSGKVVIDRWRRMCFRDISVPSSADFGDWRSCAGTVSVIRGFGSLPPEPSADGRSLLFRAVLEEGPCSVRKELSVGLEEPVLAARSLYGTGPGDRAGMEFCLNLMTGEADDRCFSIDGGRSLRMSASGEFTGSRLEVLDEWRGVRVVVQTDGMSSIWVTPLESVNRSESGYESVHQGTAFFIFRVAGPDGSSSLEAVMRLETL